MKGNTIAEWFVVCLKKIRRDCKCDTCDAPLCTEHFKPYHVLGNYLLHANVTRVILYLCVTLNKYAGVVNKYFHFILFQNICKCLHYRQSYDNLSKTLCHYCMG